MGATDEVYSSNIRREHTTKAANALNTPPVNTPPRSSTPPPAGEKRKSDRKQAEEASARSNKPALNNDAIDPNALSKALLKEFEDGRQRDITPGGSPSRKRQRFNADR
jgi:cell division cycle 20-like protein 1 (cofactor of APC complex)